MATLKELAEQLSRALVHDKRNDGADFVKLKDNSPQWMEDVIFAVHKSAGDKGPDDTVYRFIEKAADALAEYDGSYPEDAINEIEPDIYTHDLTAWLHKRNDHVYYLTEAMREFGPIDDGFQLLSAAQDMQIEEVGHALLHELRNLEEEPAEEEDTSDEITIDAGGTLRGGAPIGESAVLWQIEQEEKRRKGQPYELPAKGYRAAFWNEHGDNDYWCFPTDPNDYAAEARRYQ